MVDTPIQAKELNAHLADVLLGLKAIVLKQIVVVQVYYKLVLTIHLNKLLLKI
jgi:hypothetical protein